MRTFLRGKVTLLFMMLGLLLAVPAIALADNFVNDVVAGGNDTITAGGSTTINYKINAAAAATPQDPQAGCNAADSSPATVTLSVPTGVTASTTSLQFTACNSPQSVTFSSNTAGDYPINASVSDNGSGLYNNQANFTLHVNAATPSDTTGPVITPTIVGTLGNNNWYTSDVNLTWSVTDPESTVTSTNGCGPTNITADQNATTYTCSATSAGGTNSQSVSIKRDATAPTAVAFVDGPAAGGSYDPDSVPAAPTCTANGAISGLASCNVTGYSANAGEHTMTATATDNAGNVATANRSYSVLGWDLRGFYQPVDMGMTNTAKAGQTVPLKFEMFEKVSGDERTNVSDVKTFTQKVTCGSFEPSEDAIEQYSSGGTSLRYDTTGGQFIFNWQTPKAAGSCFKVVMTPNDTSSNALEAHFKLR